jgi:hypothetical protein
LIIKMSKNFMAEMQIYKPTLGVDLMNQSRA